MDVRQYEAEGKAGIQIKGRMACQILHSQQISKSRLGTYLDAREELLYRRWGAEEIHVLASKDGRWVWTRPRFGYRIDRFHFNNLQQKYGEWQRTLGHTDIVDAPNLSAFPKDFRFNRMVVEFGVGKLEQGKLIISRFHGYHLTERGRMFSNYFDVVF